MHVRSFFLCLSAMVLFAGAVAAQDAVVPAAPEGASGTVGKPLVKAKSHIVAAAHPLAAEAGRAILRAGGNSIDAMVTVQLVLGLVEPQSSGVGGGAFLVYFDPEERALKTYDGRETAPAGATPKLFLDGEGKPLTFLDAVVGGRSVGTPGTVKLLADVHGKHGALPWAAVVQSAIDLARNGFPVSPRLHALLSGDPDLVRSPSMRAYFFGTDGKPHPVGHILRNDAYAATLTAIRNRGAAGFYEGQVARGIIETVAAGTDMAGKANPGTLSLGDLAGYRVKERPPVCAAYRGLDVCGMGPPSSGAVAVGQTLGMLEPFDLAALGPDNVETWRLFGDATRLAFADRARYLADSDFLAVPVKGLLDDGYTAGRSKLLERETALPEDGAGPGEPTWDHAALAPPRGDDASHDLPATSHFVIADAAGGLVSMTTTIENGFGSRLMTGGFLLNNELTDFSFKTHEDGRPVANAVAPGKRPRSSMAPTIVLRDGRPVIAIGSPGGSAIIPYVAQALVAMIDWDMDAQAAVSMAHYVNRTGVYELEAGTPAAGREAALQALGYETKIAPHTSGLHAIEITPDGIEAGADPRREGVALGD